MIKLDTFFRHRYEVSQERLSICNECEFYDKRDLRCDKCGCFMEYKTLILSEECPIGKWKKE